MAPGDAGSGPLRVGLIADIQYADREDGSDFAKTEERHYRSALRIAERAVRCWNEVGVEAVIQLGDLIDGCNAAAGASDSAMAAVLRIMEGCSAKRRFDLIGNHELYNIRRSDLPSSGLRLSPEGTTFHSAHLGGMWEAIFLDPYEHALIGMKEGECGYDKAVEIMQSSNPNVLSSIGGGDWFAGLPEEKHRFVPYNGACSAEQVAWLDNALREATSNGRKVLIFTHVPLYAPATKLKTVVWNAEDVLSVLHKHQDAVVAVFAGHDHNGGYAVDSAGLHHITMNSPLTATPGSDCFAVLECHHDGIARFVAHGRACVESGTDGKGRAYSELILAKGFENTPEDGRLGTINSDDVAKLVAMGFEEEKAKLTLEAANGDVEQAAQLLVA